MKQACTLLLLAVMVVGVTAFAAPTNSSVTGRYVETRSCDVFTGPCFANGEMGLTGSEAILTWAVDRGEWKGVAIDGLKVVTVVLASNTLGSEYHNPYPAKAVVIVDAKADAKQREALLDLVKSNAGKLVTEIVDVKSAPITARIGECAESGCAHIEVEGMVEISTRCLKEGDHKCGGNEFVFYQPLTEIENATPAYTIVSSYQGDSLGATWQNVDRRSAFIGSFSKS